MNRPMTVLPVRVPEEMREKLKALAESSGKEVSEIVRNGIELYWNRYWQLKQLALKRKQEREKRKEKERDSDLLKEILIVKMTVEEIKESDADALDFSNKVM